MTRDEPGGRPQVTAIDVSAALEELFDVALAAQHLADLYAVQGRYVTAGLCQTLQDRALELVERIGTARPELLEHGAGGRAAHDAR